MLAAEVNHDVWEHDVTTAIGRLRVTMKIWVIIRQREPRPKRAWLHASRQKLGIVLIKARRSSQMQNGGREASQIGQKRTCESLRLGSRIVRMPTFRLLPTCASGSIVVEGLLISRLGLGLGTEARRFSASYRRLFTRSLKSSGIAGAIDNQSLS